KLKEASSESLHGLLDRFLPDKFRDGAPMPGHRAAADPVLTATHTTIFELRKRDDNNTSETDPTDPSTTPTDPPEPSTSDPPPESKSSTSEVPPESEPSTS